MRVVFSILCLCILLIAVFGQGITVLRYHANKQFIATKLCENRARPMLNCDGKCVLAKKLQKQEKQQEDAGIHITEKFEVMSLGIAPILLPSAFEATLTKAYSLYSLHALPLVFLDIFIPPDNAANSLCA